MVLRQLRARIRRLDHPLLWRVVELLSAVLARLTSAARWHQRHGHALERQGRVDEAVAAYETALTRPDRHEDWFLRLAGLLADRGDWAGAERTHRAALAAGIDPGQLGAGLARALEEQRRYEEAADAYREVLARAQDVSAPEQCELRFQLGRCLEKTAAWEEAIEVYERARALDPTDWACRERLGLVRFEIGDTAGALTALREAIEAAGAQAPARLGTRVAEILDGAGRWGAACDVLVEHAQRHPGHAPAQRLLAKVARQVVELGGFYEGPLEAPGTSRFCPLPETDPDGEDARDYLWLAARAMEQAVALDPRDSWWAPLADLRRLTGYLPGALQAAEHAVGIAERSDARITMKWLHRWQFLLERTHHEVGAARVDDPLFDMELTVTDEVEPSARAHAPGVFLVERNYSGLRVEGWLADDDVGAVELLLDDQVIRTFNAGGAQFIKSAALAVRRPTVDRLPQSARLRLRTPDGRELLAAGRGRAYDMQHPRGDGGIRTSLADGLGVDKKGMIAETAEQVHQRQSTYLELYDLVREFFDQQLGRKLFLMYGTLLGYFRDGDLIPGDDDFDAGYVSEAHDPRGAKEEAKDLIVALVHAGFTVSFNRRGRLFRCSHDDVGGSDIHLDLRPLWFEDGNLWVHNFVSYPASVDDFLPVEEGELRGVTVYSPRRTESFLRTHYGPGWKVPDPGFSYHPDEVDPVVMTHLDRALITPAEYRRLQDDLDGERDQRPGMGRFVSIGSQPLYPLDDFLT